MNLKKSVPGPSITHYFGNKRQFDFNTDTLDDIHINIFQPHQTYIGFSWFFNSTIRYFVFTVLSCCLSTTPSILTKVVCPFIKMTGFFAGLGRKYKCLQTCNTSKFVFHTLTAACLIPNSNKSIWTLG